MDLLRRLFADRTDATLLIEELIVILNGNAKLALQPPSTLIPRSVLSRVAVLGEHGLQPLHIIDCVWLRRIKTAQLMPSARSLAHRRKERIKPIPRFGVRPRITGSNCAPQVR